MEQVCLGLLILYWEHVPNHYDLPYLLHLCWHFTTLPQRIFPKNTYGLQRQFYMLRSAHHIMRFKGKMDFSNSDFDKVLHRCELFHAEARGLGKIQLVRLRKFH